MDEVIKNYMEIFIDDELSEILNQYENICKCPLCIEDIKAVALNQLKPLYVVTEKGSLYTKLNELEVQFKIDVIKEITNAIEIVSENPRHRQHLEV